MATRELTDEQIDGAQVALREGLVEILSLLLTAEEAIGEAGVSAMRLADRLREISPETAKGLDELNDHIGAMGRQDPTLEHARWIVDHLIVRGEHECLDRVAVEKPDDDGGAA